MRSPPPTHRGCGKNFEARNHAVSTAPVWASRIGRFFETCWSGELLFCRPGGRLAMARSCRESANRAARAAFVSDHPDLNAVVVGKLAMGTPLLVGDGVVHTHQRSLMAV